MVEWEREERVAGQVAIFVGAAQGLKWWRRCACSVRKSKVRSDCNENDSEERKMTRYNYFCCYRYARGVRLAVITYRHIHPGATLVFLYIKLFKSSAWLPF